MSMKLSKTRPFAKILASILAILAILAIALPVTSIAHAVPASPFVGHWQATDIDDSDIRLTIGGPPNGPFQITWTENYIGFCGGEAGIVRGTGQLGEGDPYLLEADLHLECFTTGASLDFHLVWRYHPDTNTLSSRYDNGMVTIWYRPGRPPAAPPVLGLRVNYGHEWVESFYEGGHMAWVTVTESDGVTIKATAELVTEPKDFWGGETGFQTRMEDWVPAAPDIQPNDWVFGWIDNGASARAQVGDISGTIDLAADSIGGTILAPWFTEPVSVECLDWSSGGEPFGNRDGGFVLTDGADPYSCSWAGEWDIQYWQNVGVAYTGPDGHWISNAFFTPMPTFVAYVPGAIEGYEWPMDSTITIDINDGEYSAQAVSEQQPGSPEGMTRVLFELWRDNFSIEAGDHIVMTDGFSTKEVVVTNLAVTDMNLGARTVSGTYDPASEPWVWLYGQDGQVPVLDPAAGTWTATFSELPPGAWGGATQWDADDDGTSLDFRTPNPTILGWLEWDVVEGNEWHPGDTVTLTVGDLTRSAVVQPSSWDPLYGYARFELGPEGYDLKVGDFVTMTDGRITKELQVPQLEVTGYDLGAHTISGTYDPALSFWIRVNEMEPDNVAFDGNTWAAAFAGLGPNMWGDAGQIDNDGDEVRATINTPNPNLYALPDENRIFAQAWTVGQSLDLRIYATSGEEIYSASQVVQPPSEVPWTVVVFDPGADGFDLLPGQRIVLNQGGYERELVLASLRITGFDLGAKIISGVGDPGAAFLIRIDGQDVWSTVAEDGTWSVYHELLGPGVWGEAIQPDGVDGDETRDGFQAPFE